MSVSAIQSGQSIYGAASIQKNTNPAIPTTKKSAAIKSFENVMEISQPSRAINFGDSYQQGADTVKFSTEAITLMQARNVTTADFDVFKRIADRAAASGGGNAPKTFLDSLSKSEMEVLRKVHTLADPIKVDSLDFEEAYNLLLPPGEAQDLNNDGLLGVGLGKGWSFPPPNAPAAVKNAFDQATAGHSAVQKALNMTDFRSLEISANIKYNSSGQPIGVYERGDADYTDIYSESGFSYSSMAKRALENIKNNNQYFSEEVFGQRKSFMEDFIAALEGNKVT